MDGSYNYIIPNLQNQSLIDFLLLHSVDIGQIIGGIGTMGAFIFMGIQIKRARDTEEISLCNNIVKEVSNLYREVEQMLFINQTGMSDLWLEQFYNKIRMDFTTH